MPVNHWQDKYLMHRFGHAVIDNDIPPPFDGWTIDLDVDWEYPLEPSNVQDGIYWPSKRWELRRAAFWLVEAERIAETL